MLGNIIFALLIMLHITPNYAVDLPFTSPKFTLLSNEMNTNKDYVCCTPLDWEGRMFLDFGTVFIDQNTAFAYFNGSVKTAWSYTKKKFFLDIKGVEQSPLIPKPVPDDSTILYDYENGVMYTVSAAGGCQKSELDNMTRQCIPGSAKLLSESVIGEKGLPVSTYRFRTNSDVPWEVTATVVITDLHPIEPRPCTPVQLIYFTPSVNPDSGSYYTLQVTDVGPLRTPGIFDIPKPCQ